MFEIKTVNVYYDDYNTVLDEAKAELNDKARPELSKKEKDCTVPFCTSGVSGISGSMKGVEAAPKGEKVVKGKELTDASYKSVTKWAKIKVKCSKVE